ncbi:MAG: hypothetical protein ACK4GO_15955 [Gemmobacter sp.]
MRLTLSWLFAVLLLVPAATAQTAAPAPDNAYGAALTAALKSDPRQIDFAALRAVYAASEGYTGRSDLGEFDKEAFAAGLLGQPVPVLDETGVNRALVADFPLAETQYAAFLHVKRTDPGNTKRLALHSMWYLAIIEVILASRRASPEGDPVYTVLSISEENHLLGKLGYARAGRQEMLVIDGVPHDRIATDKGPVLFDISAFFGR